MLIGQLILIYAVHPMHIIFGTVIIKFQVYLIAAIFTPKGKVEKTDIHFYRCHYVLQLNIQHGMLWYLIETSLCPYLPLPESGMCRICFSEDYNYIFSL
jgi:hypothetical protein